MGYEPLWSPNNTPLETQSTILHRAQIMPADELIASMRKKETASDYSPPVTGTSPGGLGFTFGDTWRRTQRGTMEFQLPTTQVDIMNMSLNFAFTNVFVSKSLNVKTNFTCKGLRNKTASDTVDTYFDSVMKRLNLIEVYRKAVWQYYCLGLAVILMPNQEDPLSWVELLDPRMCRIFKAFGKSVVYITPDQRMINAVKDPKGTSNPLNKDYYEMLPKTWVKQIVDGLKKYPGYAPNAMGNMTGEILVRLDPGSYLVLDGRKNSISRYPTGWDGAPLFPYFSAAEHFRQLMAGDFASGFVAKNLIALVSVGDPAAEKEFYQRPDTQTLLNLKAGIGDTPNSAQWSYVDPTVNIRYIRPDEEVFGYEKYKMPLEQLKNLLPSPFWFNDGSGAFAQSTTEIKDLIEIVEWCNSDFDQYFWLPLFERAAEYAPKHIATKFLKPPQHDKNSLRDDAQWLATTMGLYNSGGMDIRTLIEAHGFDYDVIRQGMLNQHEDVQNGVWMPAFESKQGIVAEENYHITGDQATAEAKVAQKYPPPTPPAAPGAPKKPAQKKVSGGAGGRPSKAGSKPQVETGKTRTPRPGGK